MGKRIAIICLALGALLSSGWLSLRRSEIPYRILEANYAGETSQFVTLGDGMVVHYRDEGPEDAPVLLLLHGLSSSLHTWDDWVADLSEDYRVISIDLPGHGLTRVFPGSDLSTLGLSNFVTRFTNELGLEHYALGGSSMGGHVAWVHAVENPGRVDALVLVAASGQSGDSENADSLMLGVVRSPFIELLFRDLDAKHVIRYGLEQAYSDQSYANEARVQRYSDFSRAPGHRQALLSIAAHDFEEDDALSDKLTTLEIPTLILQGAEDRIIFPGDAVKFEKLIPNAQLITYEGVGHLPQEEFAETSAADVKAFLGEVL